MRLSQFFDPRFAYKNRARIMLYLEKHWKLGRFKNRHRGQRCFIIGNGPSLSVNDLEMLKREITFAGNKIYLIFNETGWRPRYYVLEDDHIINQHHEEISRLKGFTKFINYHWRDYFRVDSEAIWYPWRFLRNVEFPKFSDNPLREPLYCGYTVTYISLQLAYFMGFARVYLIGVDFNYSLSYQGHISIKHSLDHPREHFIPNYYEPGELRYLPRLDCAESALRCARKFYEAHGRQILNATNGGKLEVFDRVSLQDIIRN